jgi:hypothetical protein
VDRDRLTVNVGTYSTLVVSNKKEVMTKRVWRERLMLVMILMMIVMKEDDQISLTSCPHLIIFAS